MPKTDIHYESVFCCNWMFIFCHSLTHFFSQFYPPTFECRPWHAPIWHTHSVFIDFFHSQQLICPSLRKFQLPKWHLKFKLVKLLDCLQTTFCPFAKFMCVSPILFPFLDKTIYIAWGISLAKGIKMVKVNFPNSIHTREWSNMKL